MIGSPAQSTWSSTLWSAVASERLPVLGMTTLTAGGRTFPAIGGLLGLIAQRYGVQAGGRAPRGLATRRSVGGPPRGRATGRGLTAVVAVVARVGVRPLVREHRQDGSQQRGRHCIERGAGRLDL